MKHRYILGLLPLFALGLHAQRTVRIDEGYYTMTSQPLLTLGHVYVYDTDALRAPYGNAVDYEHPCGRNGEVAYLYSMVSTSTSLVNSAYYFKPLPLGGYSVQSLSGEAYSYLSMASYDRHLVIHTTTPITPFYVKDRDRTGATQWDATERVMQHLRYAALGDSLASLTSGQGTYTVLTRIEDARITPAMSVRRALSDARGALVDYRPGNNPGEVSPLLSDALVRLVDEAQSMVDNKSTTQEQADDMIARLRQSTAQYLQAAPSAQHPVTDGYYYVVNAYRAFESRQNKEKTLVASPTDDGRTLMWNNVSVNDGSTVFRLTPAGASQYVLKSYDQSMVMTDLQVLGDAEGTWTLASSSAPTAMMTAVNHSTGTTGLYGKTASGEVTFDAQGHLYSGYTASWYLRSAAHQVSVPSSGWAVLGTSFPVEVPEGVEVYSLRQREGNLYLCPYTAAVIPACAAVVLHAARGTYTFPSTVTDAPDIYANALLPVCEARKGIPSGSMRTLKIRNGVVGFARVSSTSAVAGSAYVPCTADEADFLPLQDPEDAINGVPSDDMHPEGNTYDLQGREVNPAQQRAGEIYIMNNKKILKR